MHHSFNLSTHVFAAQEDLVVNLPNGLFTGSITGLFGSDCWLSQCTIAPSHQELFATVLYSHC